MPAAVINWYHASPIPDLHKQGIKANTKPTVSVRATPWVYIGTWEYLFEQYFRYCPPGKYYIYGVYVKGLELNDKLPSGQMAHLGDIPAERVLFCSTHEVKHAKAKNS